MSIEYEIIARRKEGQLFVLDPRARGEGIVRPIFLSEELQQVICDGPWRDQAEETRFAAILRTDLERFITGGRIRVSLLGHGHPTEDMKRLSGTNEVWEIKSERRTERGIRVFGCFAGKDVFIATHWHWRDDLEERAAGKWNKPTNWPREIRRCKYKWRRLFPTYPPHTGNTIDAYISGAEDVTVFD